MLGNDSADLIKLSKLATKSQAAVNAFEDSEDGELHRSPMHSFRKADLSARRRLSAARASATRLEEKRKIDRRSGVSDSDVVY